MPDTPRTFSGFSGTNRIAHGDLATVTLKAKEAMDHDKWAQVLVFDDVSGEVIELGEHPVEVRRPGRPKLGVVAREVTLLPRHWDWLAAQPGGASVALRKLVEQARKANQETDRRRNAQEATYRFLYAIAGNLPNFEEVIRALFANNQERFQELMNGWPPDIQDQALKLWNPN